MGKTLAIYCRPGHRYVVRPWEGNTDRLWAELGPDYTPESARELADKLELDYHPKEATYAAECT